MQWSFITNLSNSQQPTIRYAFFQSLSSVDIRQAESMQSPRSNSGVKLGTFLLFTKQSRQPFPKVYPAKLHPRLRKSLNESLPKLLNKVRVTKNNQSLPLDKLSVCCVFRVKVSYFLMCHGSIFIFHVLYFILFYVLIFMFTSTAMF